MDKRSKANIDRFIAASVLPTRLKGSEAIALQEGRRRMNLVDDEGHSTRAGRYWAQQTGEELPPGGFLQQAATRIGNVETIRLRDGTRGEVRRWDEVSGEYHFTRLGSSYFKTVRRNYIATVPVNIRGKRIDGSFYTLKSSMPVSKLGLTPTTLPSNMTSPRRREKVRALVEKDLPAILYEHSDETWTLDPDGAWHIHEETIG